MHSFMFLFCFTFFVDPIYMYWNNDSVIHKFAVSRTLDCSWLLNNENNSIIVKATVPGSVYTDLQRNKLIGDPYFKNNDILYKWIGKENWTYKTKFECDCHLLQKNRILLVLHGVDTVSQIYLNNKFIGITDNMFIKYQFDIKSLLQVNNHLEIAIESPVKYAQLKHSKQALKYVIPPVCPPPVQNGECHVNYIRKTQSSFSWDWGPSFPSQGIWKPVEIIGFNSLLINDVTVRTNPNDLKVHGKFKTIMITLHMDAASYNTVTGILQIKINNTFIYDSEVEITPDHFLRAKHVLHLKLPKDFEPKLWWPNGLGEQPLYVIDVIFSTKEEKYIKSLQYGFRTIDLVQERVANSSGLSFYFQVNGEPFFAKGSNWIPADSFLERVTPKYVKSLLQSAKDANMNMLRVWGGGIYESDTFYQLADRMGLLIWQDLMFACALYPPDESFLSSVAIEVTQQVRRLQHHPSLIVWAANNENEQSIAGSWWPSIEKYRTQYKADYVKLYISTIMPIIQAEDPTRPVLSSSPSNGPKSAEEGWIASDPQDTHYGDVHFYTYSGSEWNPAVYPRARFVSEYGFQSYPSPESLTEVSEPEDWVYPFTDFMQKRQHHMFGNAQIARMIEEHFSLPPQSCGSKGFKDVLYLSQIVQAMAIKAETEKYLRSQSEIVNGEGRTMGALYWQLNDIWPAPSWSSIEYGGKWKMLHYYARHFFSHVIVSPVLENECITVSVVSDTQKPTNLTLHILVYQWSSLQPKFSKTKMFYQDVRGSRVIFTCKSDDLLQNAGCLSKETCFLYFKLQDTNGQLIAKNSLFLSEFHSAVGINKAQINVDVRGPVRTLISDYTFTINLTTNNVAPFVWLNAHHVPGRFSDNGFLLVSQSVDIFFYSETDITIRDLSNNITVQSLSDICVN